MSVTSRSRSWTGALLFLSLWSGCEAADEETPSPTPTAASPTFQQVEQTVLTLSCDFSGCHAGSSASAGLDFSQPDLYARLVNVPSAQKPELMLVKPGAASQSYLALKLLEAEGIVGEKMPPDGEIEPEALQAVLDWIDAGAPNN